MHQTSASRDRGQLKRTMCALHLLVSHVGPCMHGQSNCTQPVENYMDCRCSSSERQMQGVAVTRGG